MRKKLIDILSNYFRIGNSYHYMLERVKEAFGIGTMSLEDFREYDEDDVAEIAEHLIQNGVTIQRWIPVTERLPTPEIEVLVCSYGYVYTMTYRYDKHEDLCFMEMDDSGYWWRKLGVSHWMPLPELPEDV